MRGSLANPAIASVATGIEFVDDCTPVIGPAPAFGWADDMVVESQDARSRFDSIQSTGRGISVTVVLSTMLHAFAEDKQCVV